MKKILSFILVITALLSLAACKKQLPKEDPDWMQPVHEHIVDFKKEVPDMSVSEAKSYLENKEADPATAEYRRAVYAVNESVVTAAVEEAFAQKAQTDTVTKLFEKIDFSYISGDALENPEIKNRLSKRGLITQDEDGNYQFTFHDRTLAQTAANVKSDHAIDAYTEVLELLLQDPNVVVDVLE